VEGDAEKAANCLANEYLQTDISGFRWEVYERKDEQVRMYGNCAVVIGALDLKGSGARPTPQHTWVADPNATPSVTLRFTHVYIKRDGKWLLAALHNQLPPCSGSAGWRWKLLPIKHLNVRYRLTGNTG
jgi:uncharacterized protein DUF4440